MANAIQNERLRMYLEAERAVLSGQSYTIGNMTLTRANLSSIRAAIDGLLAGGAVLEGEPDTRGIAVENAANIVAQIDPAGLVSTEMLSRAASLRQPLTPYDLGAILFDTQLTAHPDWRLECTTPGTTGGTLLDLTGKVLGDSVTDGTVVWTIKRLYTIEGDFFEVDTDGGIMPTAEPLYSVNFECDTNGDIMPKE